MLEGYFGNGPAEKDRKRLLAVQAALEISKATVSSATAISGVKSGYDLEHVTKKVEALADAIQAALDK
ncbi:hypothetical protein [Enterobacter hormaechei]|uniref:hypothetical protein n=1 Tax=Enterobacter hormaechei TaxID=158836 RepID=UPI0020752773|nr:hypothetical protein [unidentified bacterial endosymbiont]MCM7196449.1 hypothetical protein [Enterobacter hormaechei]